MLFAWTAAFAIAISAVIIIVLVVLRLLSWSLPAGRARTACDVLLALLGLAVATMLLWN